MTVTTGPANPGGQAVGSWGGRTVVRGVAYSASSRTVGCRATATLDPGAANRRRFDTLTPGQPPEIASVLDEFTLAWERGEAPAVEEYLERLDPADCRGAVELIYREFCLAEAAGRRPEPASVPLAISSPRRRPGAAAGAARRVLAVVARPLGRVDAGRSGSAECRRRDRAVRLAPRAGARRLRPRFSGRAVEPGESPGRRESDDAADARALAAGTGAARQHRRDRVARHGRRRRVSVSVDLHAVLGGGDLGGGAGRAAGARRGHPVSGTDLLADLDAVAAPEYPAVHPARPAREILAGLSYDQAVAWVGARLAEALDHAFSRDVAHGDVKPSNILLSADGNPMLLDFNLARDGSPAGTSGSGHDPGGTLAYMAPERLRALAAGGRASGRFSSAAGRWQARMPDSSGMGKRMRAGDPTKLDCAPHLADIYSLGMVLLEAATGGARRSRRHPRSTRQDPRDRARSRPQRACATAARGRQSARTVVRESESAEGRAISAGLSRHPRALPRSRPGPSLPARTGSWPRTWTAGGPTGRWSITAEPFWGQTVPRVLRRQRRRMLLIAAAVSLIVGLPMTAVVLFRSLANLQETGAVQTGPTLGRPRGTESHRFQRHASTRVCSSPTNPTSKPPVRALKEYGVTRPGRLAAAR